MLFAVKRIGVFFLVASMMCLGVFVEMVYSDFTRFSQTLKISDSNYIELGDHDSFGMGIAVDGTTMAAGTASDDDGGTNRGAVYIFKKESSTWVQKFKISDNGGNDTGEIDIDLNSGDRFGDAVALDGTTLVVGALETDDGGSKRGAVYIFEYASNTWTKKFKISDNGGTASGDIDIDLDNGDRFGSSVYIDGTTLVASGVLDDDGGSNRGAVYVFEKSNNTWSQTLKISDNGGGDGKLDIDLGNDDRFGDYVVISGDTIAAAAYNDDDGGSNRGAVYIFGKDDDDDWEQTFKISDNGGDATGEIDIDLDNNDRFGWYMGLDNDVLAIGVPFDDDGGGNRGAVYIFEKSGSTWSNTFKLSDNGGNDTGEVAIDLGNGDIFGNAVDIDGTTLVVGATLDDDEGVDKGAVYVFEKSNDTWAEKTDFDPSSSSNDQFGISVARDGDTLAIGAMHDDDGGSNRGAVYIFEKSDAVWSQTLKISDNGGNDTGELDINLENVDRFGEAVALDGDTLVVGAFHDDDGGKEKGAVYIFGKDADDDWEQTFKISDNGGGNGKIDIDLDTEDRFGDSVAIDGTVLVVNSRFDDDGGSNRGAVYIFYKESSTWVQKFKISDNGGNDTGEIDVDLDNSDRFGGGLSIDGDTLLISALSDDDGGGNRGAVYIYEKSSNTWSQTLKISDNGGGDGKLDVDLSGGDIFGSSTSLDSDNGIMAIGAYGDDDGGTDKGVVYIYEENDDDEWEQTYKISDNGGDATGEVDFDLSTNDLFGSAVHVDGTELVVGVPGSASDSSKRGAVYIFNQKDATWEKDTKIADGKFGDGKLSIDLDDATHFGRGTSIHSDTLVVGSYSDDDGGTNRGAVYLFEKSDAVWSQTLKISDNSGNSGEVAITLDNYDTFGVATSLHGTVLVISASGDDDGGTNRGAVYLFEKSGGTWSKTLKISDNGGGDGNLDIDLDNSDALGISSSMASNIIVVGAHGDDDGGTSRGAVYLFEKSGSTWSKTLKISDNGGGAGNLDVDLENGDHFGRAVSIDSDGNTVAVGAYWNDDGGTSRGAVYIFEKSGSTWSNTFKLSDNGGDDTGEVNVDLNNYDYFGSSVEVEGNMLFVGVLGDDNGISNSNKGAVYYFAKEDATWKNKIKFADEGDGKEKIDVSLKADDFFGAAVSVGNGILVIGSTADDDGGSNRGASYLFSVDEAAISIVDSSDDEVSDVNFDFDSYQTESDQGEATGAFGTSSQRIKVSNETDRAPWSLTLSADEDSLWVSSSDSNDEIDYNDTTKDSSDSTLYVDGSDDDTSVGALTILPDGLSTDDNPSSLSGSEGCSDDGISIGSDATFSSSITSITLLTASSTVDTECSWYLENVGLKQIIPAKQDKGKYSITMTLTLIAQ